MTEPRFKIVFDGTLLPGVEPDTAKENLAALFKAQRDAVERLFSGRPVALKRDLAESEAQKYLEALTKAGLDARIEADAMASLSLVDDNPKPVAASAPSPTQMACPKCGHEQPVSTECSACGIIFAKYNAAQAQQREFQATVTSPSAPRATSPFAPPRADVGIEHEEVGELNIWGVSGRIGRVRYLAWSLVLALVSIPVIGICQLSLMASVFLGGALLIVAYVAMTVISVMFGAKRLHDLGWSAWWMLLFIVPIANIVLGLLMLFMPGTQGANNHGAPPPPNSTAVKILAWCWLAYLVFIIAIVAAVALPAYSQYVQRAKAHQNSSYQQPAVPATNADQDDESSDDK